VSSIDVTPADTETDLDRLMTRYQNGDFAAAATLVGELTPQLVRFISMRSVSRQHTDDLVQEIWLRIHKVRHTYRPGGRFLPWFYSVARHVQVDHYRSVRRVASREQQVEEGLPEPPQPTERSPAERLDVAALLAELPESQREVVWMLKIAGMSLDDAARATSSTVGAVKQKAHRAYTRLREVLSKTTDAALASEGARRP
jgi:RNA polymerase sigma-70 factor (ECF subfamily)